MHLGEIEEAVLEPIPGLAGRGGQLVVAAENEVAWHPALEVVSPPRAQAAPRTRASTPDVDSIRKPFDCASSSREHSLPNHRRQSFDRHPEVHEAKEFPADVPVPERELVLLERSSTR